MLLGKNLIMTKDFLRKYIPEIVGTILGAAGGFLYWKYIGCLSGKCVIKSNWYLMVPWAMILGYLAGSMTGDFLRKRKKRQNDGDN
jgi:hypothetical protein